MSCSDKINYWPELYMPERISPIPLADQKDIDCDNSPLWGKVEIRGTDVYGEHKDSGEMVLIGIDAVIDGNQIKYKSPGSDDVFEGCLINPK